MESSFGHLIELTVLNLAGATVLGAAQLASLAITFSESAPKNRFTSVKVWACKLGNLQFQLNRASS